MKKKVVIIGAGPAGLSTAYELSKSDEYDITVIDLYSEMDFNKTTAGKYFSGDDGVHPNQTGRALMGVKIAENILKELE